MNIFVATVCPAVVVAASVVQTAKGVRGPSPLIRHYPKRPLRGVSSSRSLGYDGRV